jgi:hypothetical protein
MDASRKRGRPQTNGGFGGATKRRPKEMDSFQTGVGSKSKPCTKFFSTTGCPFGDTCHFLHHYPGGYQAVSKLMNPATAPPPHAMGPAHHYSMPDPTSAPSPTTPSVKTKLCTKYNTAEGCKFGDKCHYAHGERELGKSVSASHSHSNRMQQAPPAYGMGAPSGFSHGGRYDHPAPGPAPGSFGASATAKISVEASLAGAIIGKGGVNTKQICRVTGAKLAIRDHESDPNMKNIELEGTFDQINQASAMVRELIVNVSGGGGPRGGRNTSGVAGGGAGHAGPANHFKTKLCDNFAKGSCTYGERCHFAHGSSDLRTTV